MDAKVSGDAIDVEVDEGLLAFGTQEEVTVLVVVHEEVFGEDGGAGGVAEEVEVFLEVAVGVVGAEAHAGEVGLGGGVEGGGEGIGLGVATGGIGAPAAGGEPAVATAGGMGQWSVGAAVSLWPACPVTVSQRRVAIEVAGLAVWAEALPETKLTDEQVPFPLSTLASAGRWIRAPSAHIFPSAYIRSLTLICICPLCPPVDGVDKVDNGGQEWTLVVITRFAAFWQRLFCRLRISSYHCSRK